MNATIVIQAMTFLTLILHRTGNKGYPLLFGNEKDIIDANYFGIFVIYGFFFFTVLLIVSAIMDEKCPILVSLSISKQSSKFNTRDAVIIDFSRYV